MLEHISTGLRAAFPTSMLSLGKEIASVELDQIQLLAAVIVSGRLGKRAAQKPYGKNAVVLVRALRGPFNERVKVIEATPQKQQMLFCHGPILCTMVVS